MLESENPAPSTSTAPTGSEALSPASLQQQVHSLQTVVVAALMALVLLGAGLNIFLFREVSMVRKELEGARKLVADYEENKGPLLNTFLSRLHEYGQTHPDFNPIINKYNIRAQAPAQPVPSTVPAPSLTPLPSK